MKQIVVVVLLLNGLGHALPEDILPLFEYGFGIFTLQRVFGIIAVVIALYIIFNGFGKEH